MGAREIYRDLEQWEMDAKALHRRMILAATPRERERWHAVWLLAQGWTGRGHGGGAGAGSPHHRAMGLGLRRGRGLRP